MSEVILKQGQPVVLLNYTLYSSNYNLNLQMTTPVKNCSLPTVFVDSLFTTEQKHCNIYYIPEPNTGVCDRSLYVRYTSPVSTCSFRSRQPSIRLTYSRFSTFFLLWYRGEIVSDLKLPFVVQKLRKQASVTLCFCIISQYEPKQKASKDSCSTMQIMENSTDGFVDVSLFKVDLFRLLIWQASAS